MCGRSFIADFNKAFYLWPQNLERKYYVFDVVYWVEIFCARKVKTTFLKCFFSKWMDWLKFIKWNVKWNIERWNKIGKSNFIDFKRFIWFSAQWLHIFSPIIEVTSFIQICDSNLVVRNPTFLSSHKAKVTNNFFAHLQKDLQVDFSGIVKWNAKHITLSALCWVFIQNHSTDRVHLFIDLVGSCRNRCSNYNKVLIKIGFDAIITWAIKGLT